MDRERYLALQRDVSLKLTPQELSEGWFFCSCEWDGMLVHKHMAEAECCHCFGPNAPTENGKA